ncbi:MAG: hypothetical protein A2758_02415 [Candidatus Zambryskibacteria bacterium RIFCSPHIGHO2_01_FULL_49_18]|uniref:TPM domain-containing protein n=2 Tax=Candidatus Zambryskiibacteriota TaxID=1817925 RepID=A0A1G2T228_9BACT|nr:MAG: hypothetical protein A2758_02415 [Candidatus Zambryskibacteria bacterium RIFCSPHIGHO2_01_FULL_49_18]OHB06175.1 MAG: hypothetical protein A3A26_01375 [Candidatus Zambryskibacteria bacterium RIFCSPLOWO2_01_FULL_47_14]
MNWITGFILTFCFLNPLSLLGYIDPGAPLGHVNDFANLFKPETVSSLEATLSQFESETGHEIAIVTIESLPSDQTIETYAVELFEKWGIGKAKEDNGLLLLIARDDREMRIEVGYGLEPIITDIESSRIIRENLVPAFKNNDYDGGVIEAVNRIMQKVEAGELGEVEEKNDNLFPNFIYPILFMIFYGIRLLAPSKSWWFGGILGAIFGGVFFWSLKGILIMTLFGLLLDFWVSKTYKKSTWKDGHPPWFGGGHRGGGGGFGGFGGGMSGGGGASGRW